MAECEGNVSIYSSFLQRTFCDYKKILQRLNNIEFSSLFRRCQQYPSQSAVIFIRVYSTVQIIYFEMRYDKQSFPVLIAFGRERLPITPFLQKKIKQFECDYSPDKAIWCYTRKSFIYQMLNRALRLSQADTILMIGFFIIDLHQQPRHKGKIDWCLCVCLRRLQELISSMWTTAIGAHQEEACLRLLIIILEEKRSSVFLLCDIYHQNNQANCQKLSVD